MIVIIAKERVRKARTGRKVTRTYSRVLALSKQMTKAVSLNLVKGIKTFRRALPADKLFDAWKTGHYSKVMQVIPWDELPSHLADMHKDLRKTYGEAARFSVNSLPAPKRRALRFDTENPNIRNWINTRTGELIVNIHSDAQRVVQQAVMRSFDQAMTPREVADQIRGSIGLLPRQEMALRNYSRGLQERGYPPENISKYSLEYADRLLTQRTMTIARTETRFAANRGQLSVWQDAGNQNLIDRQRSRKVWVVDGNPCEICEPMDGVAVPLDGFWTLNTGDVVEIPTDAHPNCFCGMELDYGETPEGEE